MPSLDAFVTFPYDYQRQVDLLNFLCTHCFLYRIIDGLTHRSGTRDYDPILSIVRYRLDVNVCRRKDFDKWTSTVAMFLWVIWLFKSSYRPLFTVPFRSGTVARTTRKPARAYLTYGTTFRAATVPEKPFDAILNFVSRNQANEEARGKVIW